MRSGEFGAVFLELRVVEHRTEEVATDGQSRTVALSEHTCAEVDGTVFATYPCATDQSGRGADKPGIGVIVRCTRLTTEVGVGSFVVAHESHQSGAGATHATFQQLLYEEGRTVGDGLLGFSGGFVDHVAVAVFNLGHENRTNLLAVVHGRTVGIDHLEQVDVAGT